MVSRNLDGLSICLFFLSLDNTHILSVCKSADLFVTLFCLPCLSVGLHDCLLCTYSIVGMQGMCEYWSIRIFVRFAACTSTFILSICLTFYLCKSACPIPVRIYVYSYTCLSVLHSGCLPPFLYTFLSPGLSTCLSARFTACRSPCLSSCMLCCLPSWLPTHLPAFMNNYRAVNTSKYFEDCLAVLPPPRLSFCLQV